MRGGFRFVVGLSALAVAGTAPAMEAEWGVQANPRIGYQQLNADPTHLWSAVMMTQLSGNSLEAWADDAGTAVAEALDAEGGDGPVTNLYLEAGGDGSRTDVEDVFLDMAEIDATFAGAFTPDYTEQGDYFGLKDESAVRVTGDFSAADNPRLSARVAVELRSTGGQMHRYGERPVELKEAWARYDFGPLALRYSTADLSHRWDTGIQYLGDFTGQSSLDMAVPLGAGDSHAFFTVMSDQGFDGVGYDSRDVRHTPMFSAGYVHDHDGLTVTAGAVHDRTRDAGGDYTGTLAFGSVRRQVGNVGAEPGAYRLRLSLASGRNVSRFAGLDPQEIQAIAFGIDNIQEVIAEGKDPEFRAIRRYDRDSTVNGIRLGGIVTIGEGRLVYLDGRYSEARIDGSDPYRSHRYTVGLTQAFSRNLFVTPGLGYESYSVAPGDKNYDPAWGMEAAVDIIFRF